MRVLMVAEKPSIAETLARALAPGGDFVTHRRKVAVHEYHGVFDRRPADFVVTAVAGHVFQIDFPQEYNHREAVDPDTLFEAPVKRVCRAQMFRGIRARGRALTAKDQVETKAKMVRHLREVSKGVDHLVLWLDCDREGENICFEVIDVVRPFLSRGAMILRAKFSALSKPDLERAMANLVEPNRNEALAVDARQELDLKVGVAFTRFQTNHFQGRFGNLDSSVISYGPCQTPTLGFCVDRHDAIQSFQPEAFWFLEASATRHGLTSTFSWERHRVFDKAAANAFRELASRHGEGVVTSVTVKPGVRKRPQALNTVEMLKLASRVLGIGPHAAMHAAERLYLMGFCSYPRTESTAYGGHFDIRGTLQRQTAHPAYGTYTADLLRTGHTSPRGGTDVGDHPPITPVRGGGSELGGDMARLYDLIVRHFLASVSPDCTFETTTAALAVGDERFRTSGERIIEAGFKALYPTAASEAARPPPLLREGDRLPVTVVVREGQTSPPAHLAEHELITLMEKHGIGTDASIPTHINNIVERRYVDIVAGRRLQPTQLGITLVHGYHQIDPDLVLPRVRATIERECDLIAQGRAALDEVVPHSLRMFRNKYRFFVAKVAAMDALFESVFSPLAATGKPLSKCGKCRRYMKYVHLRPQRLHCTHCDETYGLPQRGTIKQYKSATCPLDGFELVLFSLGNSERAQGKSFPLCPSCYNYPPFDGMREMGCDSCLHPSCQHSLLFHGVCRCPGEPQRRHRAGMEPMRGGGGSARSLRAGPASHNSASSSAAPEDGEETRGPCPGMLVLDPNSKPNWKLACNRCNCIARIQGDLHVLEDRCAGCASSILDVQFHRAKSPLQGGKVDYRGCLICDGLLNSMLEFKSGRQKHVKLARGRRGRGRARGRGRGAGKDQDPRMSFADF